MSRKHHPATQVASPNANESVAAVWRFEQKHHNDVYIWAESKLKYQKGQGIDILDFSIDGSTFARLLCEYIPGSVVTTTKRAKGYDPIDDKIKVVDVSLNPEDGFKELEKLGKFDLIIVKEMLHEVKETLKEFLEKLKPLLKDENSRLFAITRPKNPPVPLPDAGMFLWRKMVPTREEIVQASHFAGFMQEMFLCSAPVKIDKNDWATILKARFLAAMKDNDKCRDRDIKEFVSLKSSRFLDFEEKIWILVLWLNPDGSPPVLSADMASFCGLEAGKAPSETHEQQST